MTKRPTSQGGMALVETLVASAVLGIGMMGAVQLAVQSMQTATDTRERITAHGLALDVMECHQSGRTSCPMSDQVELQTLYTRTASLVPRAGLALVDITVTVEWTGAARNGTAGNPAQLVLRSSRATVPLWLGVSLP